jgi:hypothetical protein
MIPHSHASPRRSIGKRGESIRRAKSRRACFGRGNRQATGVIIGTAFYLEYPGSQPSLTNISPSGGGSDCSLPAGGTAATDPGRVLHPLPGFPLFDGQVHREAAAGLNLKTTRQSYQLVQEKAPVLSPEDIRVALTIDDRRGYLSYFEASMSAVIAGSAFAIRASMRSTAHR